MRPRQSASARRSMEVYRSSKLPGPISLSPDKCSTGVGKGLSDFPGYTVMSLDAKRHENPYVVEPNGEIPHRVASRDCKACDVVTA